MPKSVLVVDDEADAVEFVKEILEGAGYAVSAESDGRAGLAFARAYRPDLVILDVQMPVMNGFEVFAEMKRDDLTKTIPVIMLTGIRDKVGLGFSGTDMANYYGEPPDAYVEKPVSPGILLHEVKRVLRELEP